MLTIDRVVVSMTSKIEKQQPIRNATGSCRVERLLDTKKLAWKYLTLSLKFLAGHINWTIILGQKIKAEGQSFWDGGSNFFWISLVETWLKRITVVFPLQFFWPPWCVVIKRMHIWFFGLPSDILKICGILIYR
jgi:hypothetical protein